MSGLFQIIEGETAIIREGGVYKEVAVAMRGHGELYVKAKGGFVRLYADGTTSVGSKCTLDTITINGPFYKDRLGKLCLEGDIDRKQIATEPNYLTTAKE